MPERRAHPNLGHRSNNAVFNTGSALYPRKDIPECMAVCTSSLLVFCGLWEGNNRKRPILYSSVGFFLYRTGVSRWWMVSTLVALGFYLCFLQCFCWLHRVVGSCLHWSSAQFANVKRWEWKDIRGQDHDSQPEKVDVPSPGPGQVTTPDGAVQVFWGLFHEYGESGAWLTNGLGQHQQWCGNCTFVSNSLMLHVINSEKPRTAAVIFYSIWRGLKMSTVLCGVFC